jgi:hypothetical protein
VIDQPCCDKKPDPVGVLEVASEEPAPQTAEAEEPAPQTAETTICPEPVKEEPTEEPNVSEAVEKSEPETVKEEENVAQVVDVVPQSQES